ncbi:hypothetical protein ABVP48_001935 [Clostridium perfringens]
MKDMSLVMKEAHRLTKEIKKEFPEVDYKAQLGICMSYLLNGEGENEMVELVGSEKQIAWAKEIKETLLARLNDYREKYNNSTNHEKKVMLLEVKEIWHKEGVKTKPIEAQEVLMSEINETIENVKKITIAALLIDKRDYRAIELVEKNFRNKHNPLFIGEF